MLSPGFLASYWSEGFGTFLQVSTLASIWMDGGLCTFYANAGGKQPITAPTTLSAIKQQANPLLSIHNYNPLISRNDKNKQLTLLSQRKLALAVRNIIYRYVHFLQYKIFGAPKNF